MGRGGERGFGGSMREIVESGGGSGNGRKDRHGESGMGGGCGLDWRGISKTHVSGVPPLDGRRRADVREPRDLALRLPAVPGDQAVLAVRAREEFQGPAAVVVAGVVGHCVAKRSC